MNIIDPLVDEHFVVLTDFITPSMCTALLNEAEHKFNQNKFKPAGIGRNEDFHYSEMRRSDYTYWLNFQNQNKYFTEVYQKFQNLKNLINKELFLGLFTEEFHFAFYPPGGFYESHTDSFRGSKNRLFSVVLFLNEGWNESDGGALRLTKKDGSSLYILPKSGTLVGFLSEEVEHEVCLTYRNRWSLTGWFRCRE